MQPQQDIPWSAQFLARVEAYLTRSGTKSAELGRQALGDGSFVGDLRRGRSPKLETVDRILAFIERDEQRARRSCQRAAMRRK